MPPGIGNCTSLVRFRASGNHLAGAIPPEIGKLGHLSFLDLSSNRLFGAIPAEIAGCRNLTFVDLHSNAITGVLPQGLFKGMLSLQYLDLSYNAIGGALPSEIGMLGSLTKLVLGGNRLSGKIPPEIGSCSRLHLLDLGGNSLSSAIPESIGKIPGLEITVNLSCNGLSGAMPKEFAGLTRLGVLDVRTTSSPVISNCCPLSRTSSHSTSPSTTSPAAPETAFFAKLPMSDVEGNPALCLSQCPGDASDHERAAQRAARVATAVLLSALLVLLIAAALVLLGRRQRSIFGGARPDEDKDTEMLPSWDVTMYQKLEKFRSCDDASACEIGVLPRVRHRNIVRLHGWASNHRARLLFYDYLPNGTLGGLLHGGATSAAVVEREVQLSIAIGVAEGLAYLHHDCVAAVLHRDVKGDNILLGERYEACVADFGLARGAGAGVSGFAVCTSPLVRPSPRRHHRGGHPPESPALCSELRPTPLHQLSSGSSLHHCRSWKLADGGRFR